MFNQDQHPLWQQRQRQWQHLPPDSTYPTRSLVTQCRAHAARARVHAPARGAPFVFHHHHQNMIPQPRSERQEGGFPPSLQTNTDTQGAVWKKKGGGEGADKVTATHTHTRGVAHTCVRAAPVWRHVLLALQPISHSAKTQGGGSRREAQTAVSVTPRALFMSVSARHGMQMCTLWRGGSSFPPR